MLERREIIWNAGYRYWCVLYRRFNFERFLSDTIHCSQARMSTSACGRLSVEYGCKRLTPVESHHLQRLTRRNLGHNEDHTPTESGGREVGEGCRCQFVEVTGLNW